MAQAEEISRPIQHYVDVRRRPTVIRLDALADRSDWITSSFYITRDIREHLEALVHAFTQPAGCGIFLIGQYGSGKSHWLAYITDQLRRGRLLLEPPAVVPLSLLNFRATQPLEDIVGEALSISTGSDDRRGPWGDLQGRHPNGLLLVLDELSEFLRSKPDPRAFHEDVRFLQYMGEWAQAHPFWVIAAMQEGIEHTGELEHGVYRKIKDRFPLRFLLSPAHVEDLIRESILVKKPGYEEAVHSLACELQQALPDLPIDFERLRGLYPLHPATLELLEEVRDRFSQTRGVVDFTVTQLGGDSARGTEPFLQRPMGSLLTPDLIIDHFRDLFEFQPEFLGLAQQVFPYYRKHLEELFPNPSVRDLAERLLKLLVLVFLSPAREDLDLSEAASWLLFRATRVDPAKNLDILGRVLRQFAERGRYIVERQGRYRLELRDDGMAALEAWLEREKRGLLEAEESIFELLSDELGDADFNPLRLPRDEWQPRSLRWHFHERPYFVYIGNEQPPVVDGLGLCVRLPWGNPAPAPGVTTVRPAPLSCGEELRELAVLLKARSRPWSPDVTHRLEARIQERLALFRSQLRAVYRDVVLTGPSGDSETPPRIEGSAAFLPWVDAYAEHLFRRRYPSFERYAPGHGPLSKEAYRSLMRFATQGELSDYDADDYVKLIREAYLVPMRLVTRQGRGYHVPGNLDRHELVTLIRPLLEMQPRPAQVYEHAAQSVYGLVPDQTGMLLVLLLILGEIDLRKGHRSYRELFETLPDPLQYDQIAPCRALRLEQLRDLQALCEGLQLREPKEWTVLAQRRTIRQLKETLDQQVQPLRNLLLKLQNEEQAEGLSESVRQLLAWEQILRDGRDELNDMQQFLFEIGSPRRFLGMLGELRALPERLDRVLAERKRFQHLFSHPALAECLEPVLAIRVEALRSPPGLDRLEQLDEWLEESRQVYELCKTSYRARHDAWWREIAANPLWTWQLPAVAASRHLDLNSLLEQVVVVRQRAARQRCPGLVNLDFQPLCACGFDGRSSPVADELRRLRELRDQLEQAVSTFFQQAPVRARMREWVEQGLETNPRIRSYLQQQAAYPEVADLEQLDKHLAGVELVKEADIRPYLDLLGERTWEKGALLKALAELVQRTPGTQLRFRTAGVAALGEGTEHAGEGQQVAEWCLEQTLRFGVPLPPSLRGLPPEQAERIRPDWVGEPALHRLEQLGLDSPTIDRVVRWLLEGHVAFPAPDPSGLPSPSSPLVRAAREIRTPGFLRDPPALGQLAEQLYRSHETMLRIAGKAWLDRLEALARSALPPVHFLADVLGPPSDRQYLLIDALGLPLLGPFHAQCADLFPHWRLESMTFAQVGAASNTDACYQALVKAGFQRTLEKINRVDDLLHGPYLPFDDFVRLALAELSIACRRVRSRLDPHRPLRVFADHGFRLAADGRRYVHGGDSTLERYVPVLEFAVR